MHKNHLVGCAVGIAVALALVAFTGGSSGSLGLLFAALICPITMVVAMRFLMGGMQHTTTRESEPATATEPDSRR